MKKILKLYFLFAVLSAFLSPVLSEPLAVESKLNFETWNIWSANDSEIIYEFNCLIDDSGVISKVLKCDDHFGAYYRGEKFYRIAYIQFNNNSTRYKQSLYERKKLLDELLKAEEPVVTLTHSNRDKKDSTSNSLDIQLLNFKDVVIKSRDISRKRAYRKAGEQTVIKILIIMAGLLIVFSFFWFVKKEIQKRALSKVAELKEKAEDRRVQRVAKDEAIRQTVRQTIQESNKEEIFVLKEQIKDALDKGDTKTAIALTNILERQLSNN